MSQKKYRNGKRNHEPGNSSKPSGPNLEERINRSDQWMIALTGAIVATGFVSAVVSFFQWREMHAGGEQVDAEIKAMNGQLDVMRSELRPWVAITESFIYDKLYYDNNDNLIVKFKFNFENSGKVPATNVYVNVAFMFTQSTYELIHVRDKVNSNGTDLSIDEGSIGAQLALSLFTRNL